MSSDTILHDMPDWMPESEDDMDAYSVPKGVDPEDIVLTWAWRFHDAKLREDAINTRIKELQERKAAAQRSQAWCKRMMTQEMKIHGLASVKGVDYTISYRDVGERLSVVNEDIVPRQYIDMVSKVRKADLTKAWKDTGEAPFGCEVEQTEASVTVRTK